MKKLLFISLFLLTIRTVLGQTVPDIVRTPATPSSGSNKNNRTTVDANLYLSQNLRIPRGSAFSLNNAKDSIGYIMFNTTSNRFGVYRGSGTWDTYTTTADITTELGSALLKANNLSDVTNAATALANISGVPLSRTLTINGTTFDLSTNRTWTIAATTANSLTNGYGLNTFTFNGSIPVSPSVDTTKITDLNHFNGKIGTTVATALTGKQATITLTTIGTSGVSTLIGSTLNIPNYAAGVTSFNSRTGAVIPVAGDYASLTEVLTSKSIDGPANTITNIDNGSLVHSSVTYNGITIPLGGSGTITANLTNALTFGYGLTPTGSFTGGLAYTVKTDTTIIKSKASALIDYNILITALSGKQGTGNYITGLTGDGTAGGPGSSTLTLATVNSNVGSFGSSTSIPSVTVNAKGLITAISGNAVIAPASTLSGTTLNSTIVTSSLTSIGNLTSGGIPYSLLTGTVTIWNQNTTGTASNLSGTPALPNGTTATTQTVGDNTSKIATNAFVLANSYILPSLTQYSIPIATGSTLTQDNNNFYYNYSTHLFSVGVNGDFSGTNTMNIYGAYDAYEPQSAIGGVTNGTTTPGISASTSRGTGGSPIINNTGDLIGTHSFWAYTGSTPAYTYMAGMVGTAIGTTANNLGGQLDFYVKANNGSASSAMTILNSGFIGIGTNSPGVPLEIIAASGNQFRLGSSISDYVNFSVDPTLDQLTLTSTGSGSGVILLITGGETITANYTGAGWTNSQALGSNPAQWFVPNYPATSSGAYQFAGSSVNHVNTAFGSQIGVAAPATGDNVADVYMGGTGVRTPATGTTPWVSEAVMYAPIKSLVTPGAVIPTNTSALYLFNTNDSDTGTNNWSGSQNWALYAAGSVGISTSLTGFTKPITSVFTVNTTTKGSIPVPSMTTTQKNAISSPIESLWVYDNTLHIPAFYNGSSWVGLSTILGSGQTTLVSGTKALSISGITSSNHAFVTLVSASGTSLTTQYQAVCTTGTLTIQANVAAGTINVADGSTLNYQIIP